MTIDAVVGGSHGVTAGRQQMRNLASTYRDKAWCFLEMARLGVRVLGDADLIESAVLSPVTYAQAQVQVLGATTGVHGLTVRALGIEADGLMVEAMVEAFEASDLLSRQLSERLDSLLGHVVAPGLPVLVLLGGGVALSQHEQSEGGSPVLASVLGEWIGERPTLAQHLINAGGGLVDALTPGALGMLHPTDGPLLAATTGDAARLLALLFGHRTDVQVRAVLVPSSPSPPKRPETLSDLLRGLGAAGAVDAGGPSPLGAIQIQEIRDGVHARYVVYLPGTEDTGLVPTGDETVRDMLTNYQLIGGMDNAYARGITQALRDAGLSGKEIMLVGHSQGGMVATALAADPAFRDEFEVKHVVSAGSPVAQVAHLPAAVTGLHLEHRGDAVPLLDGEGNPDQPNRVTVVFDTSGEGDLAEKHRIARYLEGAEAAEVSDHGSVRGAIRAMEESGFLGTGGRVVSVATYTLSRW